MKKYSFTIKSINDWYEKAKEPYKQYGNVPELLKEAKEKGQEVISYKIENNKNGFIIVTPNNRKELFEYREIGREQDLLLRVRTKLIELSSIKPYDPDYNKDIELKKDLAKVWNELKPETRQVFETPFELSEPEETKPRKQEKQYKSYYRAVAIYFKMKFDYENETIPEPEDEIYKLVENWKKPDGKEVSKRQFYVVLKTGNEPVYHQKYDVLKREYPKDYNYALTIFKKKHGKEFNPKDYTK